MSGNSGSIILVRHTETDDNKGKVLSGWRDVIPNDVGQAQSRMLAARMKALGGIELVVSSDLPRALWLARDICKPTGSRMVIDRRLREVDLGSLTGEHESVLHGREDYRLDGNFDFRDVGGECREEVLRRHFEALQEYTRNVRDGERVVCVGHATALEHVMRALGVLPKCMPLHKQGNYQYGALPLKFPSMA